MVSDSITTFKNNPYGQKSINLADQGYSHLAKPVLPYFSKPYGLVAPYLEKADSLGNQGLSRVDQTFPVVMEDTQTLKKKIVGYVTLPIQVADDGKKYVLDKYRDEYKRYGGEGLFAFGQAVVTTGFSVTSDSLAWVRSFLGARTEEAKESASNAVNHGN